MTDAEFLEEMERLLILYDGEYWDRGRDEVTRLLKMVRERDAALTQAHKVFGVESDKIKDIVTKQDATIAALRKEIDENSRT